MPCFIINGGPEGGGGRGGRAAACCGYYGQQVDGHGGGRGGILACCKPYMPMHSASFFRHNRQQLPPDPAHLLPVVAHV